jgi:ABC-type multidrug transport system fused ATPase/permease subunit
VVVDGGWVVEQGRHEELLGNDSGVYRRLHEAQFGAR